jgi:hypothetical protein
MCSNTPHWSMFPFRALRASDTDPGTPNSKCKNSPARVKSTRTKACRQTTRVSLLVSPGQNRKVPLHPGQRYPPTHSEPYRIASHVTVAAVVAYIGPRVAASTDLLMCVRSKWMVSRRKEALPVNMATVHFVIVNRQVLEFL